METKFFKYFQPYIIYSIYSHQEIGSLKQIVKTMKNLDLGDLSNIFKNELMIDKFLIN